MDLEYVGFATEATFLVGFGLDHRGDFRNLPAVVEVDLSELDRGDETFLAAVRDAGRAGAPK